MSSLLDLPKTSAHRLLKGLVRAGLAKDNVGGRAYQLGDRLVRLLHATADDGWIVALARGICSS
ncbi:helix-turn-helix domain-containing protein [Bradyrhizobium ottawaense]|uniref:helix-turn-helix domain-containing protein n=1 Tax=Bradyrhizobium ottawaense TaxID=931866 RepID=UPI003FA1193B